MSVHAKRDVNGRVSSISPVPDLKSGAAWLACAPPQTVETFLESLSEEALAALVTRDSMIGTGLPKAPS